MRNIPRALLLITLPLYVLDQITKWWVVLIYGYRGQDYVIEGKPPTEVIEGFFSITRVHNQGVAFGLGNGSAWAPYVFLAILPIALVVVSICWRKGFFEGATGRLSAPLLISGIAGNLTDRLLQGFWLPHPPEASFFDKLSSGYVVDFLDFTLPHYGRYPTFNVADSCIVVAAVCLFLSGFSKEAQGKTDKP